jgi:hypothetical protein
MIEPATEAAQLAAQRELAAELPFASTEQTVCERVLTVVERLFPGRAIAIRVIDMRNREPVRAYARGAGLRDNIAGDGLTVSQATIDAARLKGAVAASARLSPAWPPASSSYWRPRASSTARSTSATRPAPPTCAPTTSSR